MRLIARTIYRAFPELDRYSDEQCLRFVRAARGGWVRRGFGGVLMGAVFVVLLIGGIYLAVRAADYDHGRFDPLRQKSWPALVGLVAMLLAAAPAPLGLYLTRDWMLRRRVRFVLRSRGVCRACWYSLVGLAVDSGNRVRCPECGADMEVDPSLGELTTDEGGRVRFRPDADQLDLSRKFWTPARQRRARKVTLWTLGIGVAMVTIAAGSWEVFIRVQAKAARSARVGAEGLISYVKKHQPAAAVEGSPDGWEAVVRAGELLKRLDQAEWEGQRKSTSQGNEIRPLFDLLTDLRPDRRRDTQAARDPELEQAGRELAVRMLGVYAERGLDEALAELAACPGAVRPIEIGGDRSLVSATVGDMGSLRQLARVCAARMGQARRTGDRDGFVSAMEAGLALRRLARLQPLVIDGLVANAVERLVGDGIEASLRMHPDRAWLDAMHAAIERQEVRVPIGYHLEGDRLMAHDAIAWMFSDPGRVRFGRFSPAGGMIGGGRSRLGAPLGTFRENLRAYDRVIDGTIREMRVERCKRAPLPGLRAGDPLLAQIVSPATVRVVQSDDELELQRRGLRVMMALERFRATTGPYPATLAELVPEWMDAVPVDPWSGGQLCYKLLSVRDAAGRAYRLYSVGHNGADDGGQQAPALEGTLVFRPGDPPVADDELLNRGMVDSE